MILSFLLLFLSGFANASVTIRYYNQDSKAHTFDVKIAGSMTTVEFGGNRTSTVTIQGGASDCIIYTSCGEIRISNDAHITIKNGCITID